MSQKDDFQCDIIYRSLIGVYVSVLKNNKQTKKTQDFKFTGYTINTVECTPSITTHPYIFIDDIFLSSRKIFRMSNVYTSGYLEQAKIYRGGWTHSIGFRLNRCMLTPNNN